MCPDFSFVSTISEIVNAGWNGLGEFMNSVAFIWSQQHHLSIESSSSKVMDVFDTNSSAWSSQSVLRKVSTHQLLPFYHLTRVIHALKPCLRLMDLKKWWTRNLWNKKKFQQLEIYVQKLSEKLRNQTFKLNSFSLEHFEILSNSMTNFKLL